jgi:hypothetical protein
MCHQIMVVNVFIISHDKQYGYFTDLIVCTVSTRISVIQDSSSWDVVALAIGSGGGVPCGDIFSGLGLI